ncbi:MAG: response regulator [Acidobacteria bacterium]|nr:response regulator [Acidobacteriota bacterium]
MTSRKVAPTSSSASSAPSLLLVEDNPLHLRLVHAMLSEAWPGGVSTVSVNQLRAAVHHLRSTEVDCVLLDLVLPDSDGIESVRSIIKVAPNVPIVVLSAYEDDDTAIQAVSEGAEDYLVKGSIGPDTLHRTIRFAIARHRGRRPTDLHPTPQGHLVVAPGGHRRLRRQGARRDRRFEPRKHGRSSITEIIGAQYAELLQHDEPFSICSTVPRRL